MSDSEGGWLGLISTVARPLYLAWSLIKPYRYLMTGERVSQSRVADLGAVALKASWRLSADVYIYK